MPKTIKKRPAKKKPIQQDEVKSAALMALDKLKARQKYVIIGVSAAAAIILLLVIFSVYSSSTREKAYSLETEANKYYYGENIDASMSDEDKWKKAAELYRKSIDLKATPSALYYLGNSYYNLEDNDNAIKEYTRFADTFSSDKGILPLVYQKLASVYFKTNQAEKALETTGRLGKLDNGIFRDTALILEARYYEGAGDKESALVKYRAIVADFPVSAWAAEAGSKISAEEAKKAEASTEKTSDTSGEEPQATAAPAVPLKEPAAK